MMVGDNERGAISAQAAAMAPLLALVVLLVLFTGRLVAANQAVEEAAHEAARAASLSASVGDATSAAAASAAANLDAGGLSCRTLTVTPDLSHFHPGGWVAVTVSCVADLADMTLLGVPGARSFTETAIEVVDTYRGG